MRKPEPNRKEVVFEGRVVGEIASMGDVKRDAEAARDFLKSKGIQVEVTRFQAMLNLAVGFMNVSATLYERDLRKLPFNAMSAAPFVVNAAFAIELYLKALAQKHGVALRGHELSKQLYEALPDKAKREIETVIPQCAASRALNEAPNFQQYLKNLNSAFVEWRYSYETQGGMSVLVEPTIFAMQVLHEACHLPPSV